MEFYSNEAVTKSITRITAISQEHMYLVEGAESAVLIDTGTGLGHLYEYVRTLTKKPLKVLISHGHPDHVMGAPAFAKNAEVFMNLRDLPLLETFCTDEARKKYVRTPVDTVPDSYVATIQDTDFLPFDKISYRPLVQGISFLMGDISIEAIEIEGHSPGSMGFLIPEERVLFTGDACALCTMLFMNDTVPLQQYVWNLKKLQEKTEGKVDRILISHRAGEVPKDMIQQVISVCEEVLAGTDDKVLFNGFDKTAYFAKQVDLNRNRIDGGLANIIYNPDNLFLSADTDMEGSDVQ